MDINILYRRIIKVLMESNKHEIVLDLENLIASAATGSEILFLTGKYLLDLCHNNPLVYQAIKELIEEYLKYCKLNGIIIK